MIRSTGSPIVLYRQTLEEEDSSYEEIICTLCDGFVVEQLVVSGGPLPPSIKQQLVYAAERYPEVLIRKSKDRFHEVVRLLEDHLGTA